MIEFIHNLFLFQLLANMTDFAYSFFLFWVLQKLLLLSSASSNRVVKFVPQYPHYKNKLINNQNRTFDCIVSYIYFEYSLYNLSNLSIAFFSAYNCGIFAGKPDIIIKKRELLRNLSIYTMDIAISCFRLLSLYFSYHF